MAEEVQALEGEGEWIKSNFPLELIEGISDSNLGLDATCTTTIWRTWRVIQLTAPERIALIKRKKERSPNKTPTTAANKFWPEKRLKCFSWSPIAHLFSSSCPLPAPLLTLGFSETKGQGMEETDLHPFGEEMHSNSFHRKTWLLFWGDSCPPS